MKFTHKIALYTAMSLCALQPAYAMQKKVASAILKTAKGVSFVLGFGTSIGMSLAAVGTDTRRKNDLHNFTDASEPVTRYVKSVAASCSFDAENLRVKVCNPKTIEGHEIAAIEPNAIVMSPQNHHNLSLLLQQKSWWPAHKQTKPLNANAMFTSLDRTAVVLRHEMGHLRYKDNTTTSHIVQRGTEATLVYAATKGLWKGISLLRPAPRINSIIMALLATPALVASGFAKGGLCTLANQLNEQSREWRADAFALAHAKEPKGLLSFAEILEENHRKFRKQYETMLQDPNLISNLLMNPELTKVTPSKIPAWYFLQRSYKNRSPEVSSQKWIDNHAGLVYTIDGSGHPSPLARAAKARQRAAELTA